MDEYVFINLNKPYQFQTPFDKDFALLLIVEDESITPEIQTQISSDIVLSNCRYFMCRGHQCSTWDDSVDFACIEQDKDITTTWHENESLEETLFFLASHTFDSEKDQVINTKCVMILGENNELLDHCRVTLSGNYFKLQNT